MAKNKTTTKPVIKPTSSILAWLGQNDQSQKDTPTAEVAIKREETVEKAGVTVDRTEIQPQSSSVKPTNDPQPEQVGEKEKPVELHPEPRIIETPVEMIISMEEGAAAETPFIAQEGEVQVDVPEAENRGGVEDLAIVDTRVETRENEKPKEERGEAPGKANAQPVTRKRNGSKTYQELFFTKPVKQEGEVESKTIIRISEESHLFISVLQDSAKKYGVTLSISDLIDNLIKQHRDQFKVETEELIHQWKIRKKLI